LIYLAEDEVGFCRSFLESGARSALPAESLASVVPAKAGIHFDFVFSLSPAALPRKPRVRPCWVSPAFLAGESLSLLAQRK
jgi:hypothetical protein